MPYGARFVFPTYLKRIQDLYLGIGPFCHQSPFGHFSIWSMILPALYMYTTFEIPYYLHKLLNGLGMKFLGQKNCDKH